MKPLPEADQYALEFIHSYAVHMGRYFFPEDLHEQAFGLVLDLGQIALSVREKDAPIYGSSPEETHAIEELADLSLAMAVSIMRKIPAPDLNRLEREHRSNQIKLKYQLMMDQKAQERRDNIHRELLEFWKDVEPPLHTKGISTKWGLATLEHFINRPLTTSDMAKVLYGDQLGKIPANKLMMRSTNGVFRSSKVLSALEQKGLELKEERQQIRNIYVCRPLGSESNLQADPPTDEELREFAIQLRQEEKFSEANCNLQAIVEPTETLKIDDEPMPPIVETPKADAVQTAVSISTKAPDLPSPQMDTNILAHIDRTKIEKSMAISKPTEQWHEPFLNKFKEALKLAMNMQLDDAARDQIAKLLLEEGISPINGVHGQDQKNLAIAILLKKPSTKRLLTSNQTADTALGIIFAFDFTTGA